MRWGVLPYVGLLVVLVSGCASDRVVQPAQTIDKSITAFQTQLSSFQTAVRALQSGEQGLIAANNVQRDHSLTATRRLQIAQDVSGAGSPTEAFKILQTQANAEVAALTAAPVSAATPGAVSLPVDQVGNVAKAVAALAKAPGTKADLEYLGNFAGSVNKDLSAPKQATPAASK